MRLIRKVISYILLTIVLSGSFLIIPTQKAYAGTTYSYVDENTIRDSEGIEYKSITAADIDQENFLGLFEAWDDEEGVADNDFFLEDSEGWDIIESNFNVYAFMDYPATCTTTHEVESGFSEEYPCTKDLYIIVKIYDIDNAMSIRQNPEDENSYFGEVITISNTSLGPVEQSDVLISKGYIAGAVFPGSDWKSDPETITNGKVALLNMSNDQFMRFTNSGTDSVGDTCDGYDTNTVKVLDTKINIKGFAFKKISLGCLAGGGLREGTYRLVYGHSEAGDVFGDAQGGLLQVATVEFSGYVEFTIEEDSDGYGAITYLEASQEGENEINAPTTTKGMAATNGIHIDVTETSALENSMLGFLKNSIQTILAMITFGIETGGKWIHAMLIWGNDIEGEEGVTKVWKGTRNMALSLLTIGLLIIAFANILNIQVEQYGITRIIPKLIMAIIMTFFSYLIAAFLLDFMSALQALLINTSDGKYVQFASQANSIINAGAGDAVAAIAELIFLVLLGIFLFLVIIWLLLVLVVRTAMIYILVALAPIAFMANVLPFTEKYYKQWWATFWKWGFIGPAITFMLWLTSEFLGAYYSEKFGSTASATWDSWMWLIAAAVMIFLAATLPLKMGNEIYGAVGKQKDKIPGMKFGKQFLDQRKGNIDQRRKTNAQRLQRRLAQGGIIGRKMAGMSPQQAAGAESAMLASMADGLPEDETINKVIKDSSGLKRLAAIKHASSKGLLDGKDMAVVSAVDEAINSGKIPGLDKTIAKEQGDFYTNAVMEGATQSNITNNAAGRIEYSKAGDLKRVDYEYLAKQNDGAQMRAKASSATWVDSALSGNEDSKKAFAAAVVKSRGLNNLQTKEQLQEVHAIAQANTTLPTDKQKLQTEFESAMEKFKDQNNNQQYPPGQNPDTMI